MDITYAVLKPNGIVHYSKEDVFSTYDLIKRELDDATFDVVQIEDLDIFCDDEFLLKEMEPTLIIKNIRCPTLVDGDEVLCGPLFFASVDAKGDTISLTEDALAILSSFIPIMIGDNLVWLYENFRNR